MTQSCDSLPKLGELTCDRFFSMTREMPFDLFLGISLGLLAGIQTSSKVHCQKCVHLTVSFKSQKDTCVPKLFSSLCQMLCPLK